MAAAAGCCWCCKATHIRVLAKGGEDKRMTPLTLAAVGVAQEMIQWEEATGRDK